MILIYTFYNWNAITYKALRGLKENPNVKKLYIRGLGGAQNLVSHILKNDYSHILGLGDYRRNALRVRIEERFINKYGKNKIIDNGPKYYESSWGLSLNDNIYIADNPSWGPCNRSAYLLAHAISTNNLSTKLAFVHIPRSYKKDRIVRETELIRSWLEEIGNT
jgi:hypothetical protein